MRTKDGNPNDFGDLPMFNEPPPHPPDPPSSGGGGDDGRCPTCGVKTKEWRKRIISTAVASLCRLVRLYEGEPLHHDVFTVLKKDRNFSQLVLWGLVEQGPNFDETKRSAGTWFPTEKGKAFVLNGAKIQSHVVTYDNELVGFSGDMVDVQWALNKKFDYQFLLSENFF